MSSIAGQAALLAAAADLDVVRLIRDAIRTADLSAGQAATSAPSSTPTQTATPATSRFISQPGIERSGHINHEPVGGSGRITVSHPRIEAAGRSHCESSCKTSDEHAHSPIYFVIQPPWAVLPWENPPPIQLTVKMVVVRPDILHKGTMIDSFI